MDLIFFFIVGSFGVLWAFFAILVKVNSPPKKRVVARPRASRAAVTLGRFEDLPMIRVRSRTELSHSD